MSSWDDVKPWIAKLAPMIGTALGGPVGLAAGTLLSNALGIKDATPESIKAALQNGTLTGDQIVALKLAEEQFQLQCEAMGFKNVMDLKALEYQDRASARTRQMTIKDKTPNILVFIALALWGLGNGFLLWMAYGGRVLPPDMVGVIMRALGTMDALLGTGFAFFLGANPNDSQIKEMLYRSTPTDRWKS